MNPRCRARRTTRALARAGVAGSGLMLAVSFWTALAPAGAATYGGHATVVDPTGAQRAPMTAGTKATPFSLGLPEGAACTGDSAIDGYRVQSYMVPEGVNPHTLQFDSTGPMPNGVGASFRQPLYQTNSNPYVNAQTAAGTEPSPGASRPWPGPIVNIPDFDFQVFTEPGQVPAGNYHVGIACTLGPPSENQLDTFWNARIAVTADAEAWTVLEAQEPPAPSTTTTTATTTTTIAGSSTTTTALGESTTTTIAGDSTSTGPAGGFGSTGGGSGSGATEVASEQLVATGGDAAPVALWAALLLIFGRAAVLLGRPLTTGAEPALPSIEEER